MVRREFCDLKTWITALRAHIGGPQITRTFEVITAPSWYCQIFTLLLGRNAAVYCWFLLDYPSHHGQMAVKGLRQQYILPLTGGWLWCTCLCCFQTDVLCHHSPYKTCQFSRNCCYRYIFCFPMTYEFIVSTPQSCVCFICIRYNLRRIPVLPRTQFLWFMSNSSFTYPSRRLN